MQCVVSDEARERRRDNSQCCYQSCQRYFAKFYISREGHLYGLIFGHMINGYLNTVSRHFQHRAFSENSEISRNPVESSISCSRSCPVQSHPLHAGTAPAHCATEPGLYTPLLPGLGGRLFILYVTKLIIQLLTDYRHRRSEIRLKYINILNIM